MKTAIKNEVYEFSFRKEQMRMRYSNSKFENIILIQKGTY